MTKYYNKSISICNGHYCYLSVIFNPSQNELVCLKREHGNYSINKPELTVKLAGLQQVSMFHDRVKC